MKHLFILLLLLSQFILLVIIVGKERKLHVTIIR
jgi:hypothetical protein